MLGDVGDPQLVRVVAVEPAIDEIVCSGEVGCLPPPGSSRDPLKADPTHQQVNRLFADGGAISHCELGVDTPVPVHTSKVRMHLSDRIGEPCVTNRSLRHRTDPPGVEARRPRRPHLTGHLDGKPLRSHHRDGCEPALMSACSLSNSVAR